jgi:hypothetical protein
MLELMLATTLIALLAASLYASLRIGMKAGQGALAAVDPTRRLTLAMDLIAQDFQAAAVPNGTLAGSFEGQDNGDGTGLNSDSVSFYTIAPAGTVVAGTGDIRLVALYGQPSPDGRDIELVRDLTTNLLAPQPAVPTEEVLCRGLRMFNLRYYDGANWFDSWDSNSLGKVLPTAVEVTLQINRGRADSDGTIGMVRIVPIPCGQPSDANSTASAGSAG